MAIKLEDFSKVSIDDLTNPKGSGFHTILRNQYWSADKDGNVFFYKKTSPQCNSNRLIVERFKHHPDMTEIVFVPVAIYPININDY